MTDRLPDIDDGGTHIDGSTQPGSSCGTVVDAGGALTDRHLGNVEFGIKAEDNKIENLAIFGNLIGTNIFGSSSVPNGDAGLHLEIDSGAIGGVTADHKNLISGNNSNGVEIIKSNINLVTFQGNYVGTDILGTSALPNQGDGIFIEDSDFHFIGGNVAGAGNLILGNAGNGIFLKNTQGNTLAGNRVGVDVSGGSALANGGSGIMVTKSVDTVVGGVGFDSRNLVSGNSGHGISFDDGNEFGSILGNYVGIDSDGLSAIPNANDGINVLDSKSISVGDGSVAGRNIGSGNTARGIVIGNNVDVASVKGNYVGLNFDGSAVISNGTDGIVVNQASNVTVGGPSSSDGNLVSGNPNYGILVNGNSVDFIVSNNVMGVLANGSTSVGIGSYGIGLSDGLQRGVVSKNTVVNSSATGVELTGDVSEVEIVENYIGVLVDGVTAAGNYDGILISEKVVEILIKGRRSQN